MAYNENTDLVRGESMMIYVKEGMELLPIAFATNSSEDINTDTIDTSNKMSGKWKAFMTGQSGWTYSTDFLYSKATGHLSYTKLKQIQTSGTPVVVQFGFVKEDSEEFELDKTKPSTMGTAYITALNRTSEKGGIVQGSASFQGSGVLEDVPATT